MLDKPYQRSQRNEHVDSADELAALRQALSTNPSADKALIDALTLPLSSSFKDRLTERLLLEQRVTTTRTSPVASRVIRKQPQVGESSGSWTRLTSIALAAAVLCVVDAWSSRQSSMPGRTGLHDATTTADQPRSVPHDAEVLVALATTYRDEKNYPEAVRVLYQVLQIRERTLGPGDSKVAATLIDLAKLYEFQHEIDKARELLHRAEQIQPSAVF